MFFIVDLTTGEVLAGPMSAADVDTALDTLTECYPTPALFVQADCESGYGMAAEDWLGIA